jgi:NADPH:quinone reductase-like Zn-dependent oxidoreductase
MVAERKSKPFAGVERGADSVAITLRHRALQPGQHVLIHAGSGNVGHFAVELAKWKRAYVFATASTKHQDSLRELGVDKAIDYTQQRFEDAARNIDIVLDTIGGETQERSWSVLKKDLFRAYRERILSPFLPTLLGFVRENRNAIDLDQNLD